MNFLEKLEMLMKNKQVNRRQLSMGSDIPYSTIDNLWKKGYDNIKLSTLKKLASYFGVTIDFLARDELDEIEKSPAADSDEGDIQKQKLIHNYHKLNTDGKDKLVDYSDDLAEMLKYTELREAPRLRTIPYSTIAASAGAGEDIDDNSWENREIPDLTEYRQADFAVRVHGNSMLPDYEDGDIVLVHQQDVVSEGAVGLFWVKGKGGVIKKMGRGELISLNQVYDNIPYDTNKGRCFGRVIGKWEDEE